MNLIETILADYPVVAWAAIGVTFLIVEILLPNGFFLPFAAAGAIMAAGAWLGFAPEPVLLKLVVFTAIGVALIVPLRALLRRFSDKTPDINVY